MTDKKTRQTERPPVVVIMGHIDHGKSKLLDYIRETNIVDGEAGGITQHTSAYEAEFTTAEGDTKKVTFLDTPGHEAFTDMRKRGAVVADIAVLVVSAEDGVMPQTLEALKAITDAAVPYIVAINKIDKPNADIERTKSSLLEHGIYIEGMGGDIPWVGISAKRGDGVPELLEMMTLVAEMQELTADTSKTASGYVIEANVDPKKGISATLVIKDGSMKRGQCICAENAVAPVRIFEDFRGRTIQEASVSSPVRIVGWSRLPNVGSTFTTYDQKRDAELEASGFVCVPSSDINTDITPASDITTIPLVIKTDVSGTLDAVMQKLPQIETERIRFKVLASGVGSVTEGDLKMVAGLENPIVIGFNSRADARATSYAEQAGITIHTFDIIYKLTEWLEDIAKQRTPEREVEKVTGEVKVLRNFSRQKDVTVLGGRVVSGQIETGNKVRIMRRGEAIGSGEIIELQIQRVETKVVKEENEFGARIRSTHDIAEGDVLEVIVMVKE